MIIPDLPGEKWKHIDGFLGYMVSNKGRVKSLARTVLRHNWRPQTIRERILKHSFDELGYPMVRLYGHTKKVHTLMCKAFWGETPSGMVIRHMDGNPRNCVLENMEFGTPSQNIMDCYRYRGNISKDQKLTIESAKQIKLKLMSGEPSVRLAREYRVTQQTICDIKHQRIYAHVEV